MTGIKAEDNSAPRVVPARLADLGDEDRAMVEPLYESADTKNILMTLANHPQLLREWLPITRYVFNQSTLEATDIELICLRTTWCCGADYEYTHHAKLAALRGLTSEEIDQVPVGSLSDVFGARQTALIQTVDSLLETKDIEDSLWKALSEFFSIQQILDIVVTCGNYATISLVQRSVRVRLEDDVVPHPHFSS